ncbi:MAG TPA: aspartyl-phosphate phosphatase Spo0E family protein [Candidatus Avamphibacillus sp.]|nr:aspartyl-phosphate phosphatase Spo0E family protein [Candidatus Avamphibacillus sp.]
MKELEKRIEQLREKMYRAYNENQIHLVLKLSTELDILLNQLDKQNRVK